MYECRYWDCSRAVPFLGYMHLIFSTVSLQCTWLVGQLPASESQEDQEPHELHPLPHLPSLTQTCRSWFSCSSSANRLPAVTWQLLVGWPRGEQTISPRWLVRSPQSTLLASWLVWITRPVWLKHVFGQIFYRIQRVFHLKNYTILTLLYLYIVNTPVLGIHDILVRSRIRIHRSVPLTNGSGSAPNLAQGLDPSPIWLLSSVTLKKKSFF